MVKLIMLLRIALIIAPLFGSAQTKRIIEEIRRAGKYEESKKFDTYHAYEKYLTAEQRYQLNMYYWGLRVDIPNEKAENYWLLKSAQRNNVCAQINLAYSYKIGRTLDKDSIKCRYWLMKAIKNNSKSALLYFGLSCTNGVFSKATNDSALYYLEKAGEENIPEACLALSYCYKNGIYTNVNVSIAQNYFLKFKNIINQDYNIVKENFVDLDSSIYCPTGYCNRYFIEKQITNYLRQLRSENQLQLIIESYGSGDYLEQQQSWEKSSLIWNTFITNGIDPKRLSFRYGENGNTSKVKLIVRKIDNEIIKNKIPPPFPGMRGKYLILNCY